MWSRELDTMILVEPCQLRMLCHPAFKVLCALSNWEGLCSLLKASLFKHVYAHIISLPPPTKQKLLPKTKSLSSDFLANSYQPRYSNGQIRWVSFKSKAKWVCPKAKLRRALFFFFFLLFALSCLVQFYLILTWEKLEKGLFVWFYNRYKKLYTSKYFNIFPQSYYSVSAAFLI